jgi:predicted DCC family thiol-disulfide oxidoreductase YuxK
MPSPAPAQAKWLLLYDGECRFCIAGSTRLAAMARPGLIERVDLRDRAAMARHPSIPRDVDLSAIRLVTPDGRMSSGAEAIARALGTRPAWKLVTWLYWVPGIRQLTDAAYGWVARNRFRIMGRAAPICESGSCALPTAERRKGAA